MFLTNDRTFMVHYKDCSIGAFEVGGWPNGCLEDKIRPVSARPLAPNLRSSFLQLQRAAVKKDLFVSYDLTAHFLYWWVVDFKQIKDEE